MVNTESKKNILWINYVKAFCMLGIYFLHCESYYGYNVPYIGSFISPIYVNAFFFISGYLLFRKQLSSPLIDEGPKSYVSAGGKTLFNNILFRIAIPSILFAAIEFFPSYILRGKDFGIGEFLLKTVGGETYWFNSALVVAELLVLLMLLTRRQNIIFYFVFSMFVFSIGYYIAVKDIDVIYDYWEWKQGLLAMSYISLGGIYWKLEKYIDKIFNKFLFIIPIVIYLLLGIFFKDKFKVTISTLNLNIPGLLFGLVGTIALIGITKKIKEIKFLNYLGQNTIGFYFMSGALPIVLGMLANKIIPDTNVLGLAIVYILSIFIAYVAVMFINKFLPFLFDLRKLKK